MIVRIEWDVVLGCGVPRSSSCNFFYLVGGQALTQATPEGKTITGPTPRMRTAIFINDCAFFQYRACRASAIDIRRHAGFHRFGEVRPDLRDCGPDEITNADDNSDRPRQSDDNSDNNSGDGFDLQSLEESDHQGSAHQPHDSEVCYKYISTLCLRGLQCEMGRDQAKFDDNQENYLGFARRFDERDRDSAEEECDEERNKEVISFWPVLSI